MRSGQLLTELYRAGKAEKATLASVYELELALEDANRAVGRFEFDHAAEILAFALQQLPTIPRNESSLRLRARCLVAFASIRRDQGRLLGPHGAISMYKQAREIWQHIGAGHELARVALYLGACSEMEKNYSQALKYYNETIERAEELGGLPSLKAKAFLRIGTVLTKTKALDEADVWLERGTREYESRALAGDYSLARQKQAILKREQGDLDKALDIAYESALSVPDVDSFRNTQTKILMADLLLSAGEEDRAISQMVEAESLALTHGFYHQLGALHDILDRFSEGDTQTPQGPVIRSGREVYQQQDDVYRSLCERLSLGQMRELCYRLHIDYHSLYGESQTEKIGSLLIRVRLLDQWDNFVEQVDQIYSSPN